MPLGALIRGVLMTNISAVRYLIVPGWYGSAAEHWQSHWHQVLPNCHRVEQRDWLLN